MAKSARNKQQQALLSAIDKLYELALQPDGIERLTATIASLFQGDMSVMFTTGMGNGYFNALSSHNLDPELLRIYETHYQYEDIYAMAAAKSGKLVDGFFATSEELVPPAEAHKTNFFNETFHAYEFEHAAWGLVGMRQAFPVIFGCYRSAQRGPFNDELPQMFDLLAPHIRRVFRLREHLQVEAKARQAYIDAFAVLGYGVILATETRRVLYANVRAESVLRAGEVLTQRFDVLCARTGTIACQLDRAFERALLGIGNVFTAFSESGAIECAVTCVPYAIHHDEDAGLPIPAVLLLVHERNSQSANADAFSAFASSYSLTAAEARVLRLLLQSHSPQAIAEQCDVSIRTVRTQLSSIFRKTDTRNQGQLIALALRNDRSESP